MIVSEIAVFERATGGLAYLAPATMKPDDASLGWRTLPEGYSDKTHSWSAASKAMLEDPAKVEVTLIAGVKTEAERRKMLAATVGGFKKAEYAAKRCEVIAWDTLGNTLAAQVAAFTATPNPIRALRFEYAIADATAFGDAPADAISRFRAGIGQAPLPARIAAAEAKACAAIRAATFASAKRTAAGAVTWPA